MLFWRVFALACICTAAKAYPSYVPVFINVVENNITSELRQIPFVHDSNNFDSTIAIAMRDLLLQVSVSSQLACYGGIASIAATNQTSTFPIIPLNLATNNSCQGSMHFETFTLCFSSFCSPLNSTESLSIYVPSDETVVPLDSIYVDVVFSTLSIESVNWTLFALFCMGLFFGLALFYLIARKNKRIHKL